MGLNFYELIMSDVVFFFTWYLLGNRVSKTRFLTQKNFKKFELMSDVVFFFTCHLLGNRVSKTRFLTQKNLKKFEVSCIGRNTQKQIQEKNINPNPKDSNQREREIRGRERLKLEGEKDSSRGDPGRPKSQRPRRASPRPKSRAAWGDQARGDPSSRALGLGRVWPGARAAWGDPGARASGLGRTQWFEATNFNLQSRSSLPFYFFFFLGSSLMFWWFLSYLFLFIRDINRVLETRFPCNRHVEKYATSDVIRAYKSSIWCSIYRPTSSLIDSRC